MPRMNYSYSQNPEAFAGNQWAASGLNYSVDVPRQSMHFERDPGEFRTSLSKNPSTASKYSTDELKSYKQKAIEAEKKLKQRNEAVKSIQKSYRRYKSKMEYELALSKVLGKSLT